jgi:hypothetical protein
MTSVDPAIAALAQLVAKHADLRQRRKLVVIAPTNRAAKSIRLAMARVLPLVNVDVLSNAELVKRITTQLDDDFSIVAAVTRDTWIEQQLLAWARTGDGPSQHAAATNRGREFLRRSARQLAQCDLDAVLEDAPHAARWWITPLVSGLRQLGHGRPLSVEQRTQQVVQTLRALDPAARTTLINTAFDAAETTIVVHDSVDPARWDADLYLLCGAMWLNAYTPDGDARATVISGETKMLATQTLLSAIATSTDVSYDAVLAADPNTDLSLVVAELDSVGVPWWGPLRQEFGDVGTGRAMSMLLRDDLVSPDANVLLRWASSLQIPSRLLAQIHELCDTAVHINPVAPVTSWRQAITDANRPLDATNARWHPLSTLKDGLAWAESVVARANEDQHRILADWATWLEQTITSLAARGLTDDEQRFFDRVRLLASLDHRSYDLTTAGRFLQIALKHNVAPDQRPNQSGVFVGTVWDARGMVFEQPAIIDAEYLVRPAIISSTTLPEWAALSAPPHLVDNTLQQRRTKSEVTRLAATNRLTLLLNRTQRSAQSVYDAEIEALRREMGIQAAPDDVIVVAPTSVDYASASTQRGPFVVESIGREILRHKSGSLRWSATGAETFLSCPAKWFYQSALGLFNAHQLDELAVDKMRYGNLIHSIAEDFFAANSPADVVDRAAAESAIGVVVDRQVARFVSDNQHVAHHLLHYVEVRAHRDAIRLLDVDQAWRERFGPTSWQTEVHFDYSDAISVDLGSEKLFFRGSADRLDRHVSDDGTVTRVAVIDYKTGAKTAEFAKTTQSVTGDGTRMQPLIYQTMAQRSAPGATTSAAYWFVNNDTTRADDCIIDVAPTSDPAAALSEHVNAAIQAIDSGIFAPHPDARKCGMCDYQQICPSNRAQIWDEFLSTPQGESWAQAFDAKHVADPQEDDND